MNTPTLPGIPTEEELVLNLFVGNSQWVGQFDALEVFRSRSGPSGPWESLTDDDWSPARIPKTAPDLVDIDATGPSVTIVGKTLNIRVQEDVDVPITFTGTDPLFYNQAATQIVAQGLGLLTAYVVAGTLVIETVKVGGAAILRVVGGDAAAILGLPYTEPGSLAFGREARISLALNKEAYSFTDQNGSADYYYRTRFYNSAEGTFSDFSEAFNAQAVSGVTVDSTVIAYTAIVDTQGKVSSNLPVLLHSKNRGARVEGVTAIGGDVQQYTDDDGRVQFTLVRGQQYTVAIGGTDIVRDFTAPIDPTILSFDMFDVNYSSDDAFNVQKPNITFAARRSI